MTQSTPFNLYLVLSNSKTGLTNIKTVDNDITNIILFAIEI